MKNQAKKVKTQEIIEDVFKDMAGVMNRKKSVVKDATSTNGKKKKQQRERNRDRRERQSGQ